MVGLLPPVVGEFLGAGDPAERDEAWSRFVEEYSRLLLHVTRSVVSDPDEAMDAYAWVLEHLRTGRCFGSFQGRDGARFTTWLVVVARRMTLDFLRHRRGRIRRDSLESPSPFAARDTRLRLLELGNESALNPSLPDPHLDPGQQAERAERTRMLGELLEDLAPRDRLLLSLRFEDELSGAEIAEVMGYSSPFGVYRRLKQLLPLLRDRLRVLGIEGVDG